MSADIVEATKDYLSHAMAGSLGITPTNPGIFSDFAAEVGLPYAVVLDPDEHYTEESSGVGDSNDGGQPLAVIAQGMLQIVFVASSKVQVRLLARQCIRLMSDSVVELFPRDGRLIELKPIRTQSVPVPDVGPGLPVVFKRVAVISYIQEFLE
jgi:hypothetical protein